MNMTHLSERLFSRQSPNDCAHAERKVSEYQGIRRKICVDCGAVGLESVGPSATQVFRIERDPLVSGTLQGSTDKQMEKAS